MFYSLLYTLAMLLVAPFMLLHPRLRSKYLPSLRERLGPTASAVNATGRPSIWVHAVSVGEALAAKTLVAELRRRFPEYAIVVSTTTETGQRIAETELRADAFFYFPFDWKFAIRRALRATNARLCVVMETELWPNFIRVLSRRGVPLILANGRVSDRSFRRYRRLKWLFGPLLCSFHTICAQSDLDADRLVEIGARQCDVEITGNLKYQREQFDVPDETIEKLGALLSIKSGDPIFLAGSTHEGEEAAALDAFKSALENNPSLRLIIVPRKPERFDEVAGILKRGGWDFRRFTELKNRTEAAQVILVDAIGQLKALYHLSTVAFVGGSLAPVGGHNLLESAAAGIPVLFGPHMSNFRSVSADVLQNNAGIQVGGKEELTLILVELLADEKLRRDMAEGAAAILLQNQQALPRTAAAISEAMPRSGIKPPSKPLRLLAGAHAMAARILRGSPEKELLKAEKLSAPTISIGSLSFGGAGKTPMTATIARHFISSGERPAVLTRGYGGRATEPFIVSDGKTIFGDAGLTGDEPAMLARSVTGLIVIKDRNRLRGSKLATEQFEPSIFILDDGFQHRAIARDFNLLLLDADSVVGAMTDGQLLREPLDFATASDAVVILDGKRRRAEFAEKHLSEIGVGGPFFRAAYKPVECYDLVTREEVALAALPETKLIAFCGIANPGRFAASLAETGCKPSAFLPFRDHHRYSGQELDTLARLLKRMGGDAMITTEKDAQRLSHEQVKGIRILVLRVDLIVEDFENLVKLVEQALVRIFHKV